MSKHLRNAKINQGALLRAIEPAPRLIYDGDCQICTRLACALEREPEKIQTIDARLTTDLRVEAERRGFDLDRGMLIEHAGDFYHGHRALAFLADHIPRRKLSGRVLRALAGQPALLRATYAMFTGLRRVMLWWLAKPRLRPLADGTAATPANRLTE